MEDRYSISVIVSSAEGSSTFNALTVPRNNTDEAKMKTETEKIFKFHTARSKYNEHVRAELWLHYFGSGVSKIVFEIDDTGR